jgi:hypothetical protein
MHNVTQVNLKFHVHRQIAIRSASSHIHGVAEMLELVPDPSKPRFVSLIQARRSL